MVRFASIRTRFLEKHLPLGLQGNKEVKEGVERPGRWRRMGSEDRRALGVSTRAWRYVAVFCLTKICRLWLLEAISLLSSICARASAQ